MVGLVFQLGCLNYNAYIWFRRTIAITCSGNHQAKSLAVGHSSYGRSMKPLTLQWTGWEIGPRGKMEGGRVREERKGTEG